MQTKQKYVTAEELRKQAINLQDLRDSVTQVRVDQFLTDIFYPVVQTQISLNPQAVHIVFAIFLNRKDVDEATPDGKFLKFITQTDINMYDLANSDFFRLLRLTMTPIGFTVSVSPTSLDESGQAGLTISWAEQKATKR